MLVHFDKFLYETEVLAMTVSLEDILRFFTGSKVIPIGGLSMQPRLQLDSKSALPMASACLLSLSLLTKFETYIEFKNSLEFGFSSCESFDVV